MTDPRFDHDWSEGRDDGDGLDEGPGILGPVLVVMLIVALVALSWWAWA